MTVLSLDIQDATISISIILMVKLSQRISVLVYGRVGIGMAQNTFMSSMTADFYIPVL